MKTLKQIQKLAIAKLIRLSPGVFVYGNNSITVFKSPNLQRRMNPSEYGMQLDIDDLYVIADIDDVSSWNLDLLRMATVTLDGDTYGIGATTNTMPGGLTIYLKRQI